MKILVYGAGVGANAPAIVEKFGDAVPGDAAVLVNI